jgi:L-fuconate dehydratase
VVRRGRYQVPTAPGTSITMKLESLDAYRYSSGEAWKRIRAQ